MKYFLVLIAGILLSSCEKEYKLEIPTEEDKTAIEVRVNSGDTISALVSSTESVIYGSDPNLNINADVYLYENEILVDTLRKTSGLLSYPNHLTNYKSNYVAKVGYTYKLSASYADHKTVYGQTIVPTKPEVSSIKIDSTKDVVTIEINDNPNTEDFYLIDFKWENGETMPIYQRTTDPTLEILYGTYDFFTGDDVYIGYISVIKDEKFNGQVKKLQIEYIADEAISQNSKVKLVIKHITRDFYKHERSKASQLNAEEIFFPVPTQVYSNVIDGYGVVIGSADSTITFTP